MTNPQPDQPLARTSGHQADDFVLLTKVQLRELMDLSWDDGWFAGNAGVTGPAEQARRDAHAEELFLDLAKKSTAGQA